MKLFELFATLSLQTDDFNRQINGAVRQTQSFSDKISAFGAKAAKAATVIGTATAATVGSILKGSLENYAEYEQLVGGIETLFKGSSKKVIKYAENAFQTAGLSANDYMKTATGFAASLLQSLDGDTEKVAEYTDMAIRDMSDNANKMGTDMSMIQNAYQGFAKQNYTMLDNLKLGFGGTKTEMIRLLETATELTGKEYDIDNLSDVFEAIHAIQEQMGITGTTAAEAKDTISGSISSWKASFDNLLTSFATGNEELQTQHMNDLIESTKTVVNNIVPAAQTALEGIGTVALAAVETIWDEHLPQVATDGANLIVNTVNEVFGTNIPTISAVDFPTWEEVKESAGIAWETIKAGIQQQVSGYKLIAKYVLEPDEWTEEDAKELTAWWDNAVESVKKYMTLAFELLTPPGAIGEIRAWWSGVTSSVGKLMLRVGYSFDQFNPDVNMELGLGSTTHGDGNSGGGSGKGFAVGLDYVPYNNFRARLHEGEAVLTKAEATAWRRGEGGGEWQRIEALMGEIRDSLAGFRHAQIYMDGTAVGNLVTDRVSRNIAQAAWAGRYNG